MQMKTSELESSLATALKSVSDSEETIKSLQMDKERMSALIETINESATSSMDEGDQRQVIVDLRQKEARLLEMLRSREQALVNMNEVMEQNEAFKTEIREKDERIGELVPLIAVAGKYKVAQQELASFPGKLTALAQMNKDLQSELLELEEVKKELEERKEFIEALRREASEQEERHHISHTLYLNAKAELNDLQDAEQKRELQVKMARHSVDNISCLTCFVGAIIFDVETQSAAVLMSIPESQSSGHCRVRYTNSLDESTRPFNRLLLAPPSLCGYLTKRGHKVKNWKKRWVRLFCGEISYYEKEEDRIPLQVLGIGGKPERCEEKEFGRTYCWRLPTQDGGETIFQAESEEDAESWLHAISAYCR